DGDREDRQLVDMDGDGAVSGDGSRQGFGGAVSVLHIHREGMASVLGANVERQVDVGGIARNLERGDDVGAGRNVASLRSGGSHALDRARTSLDDSGHAV